MRVTALLHGYRPKMSVWGQWMDQKQKVISFHLTAFTTPVYYNNNFLKLLLRSLQDQPVRERMTI